MLNTFKVKEMICCSHTIFLSFVYQVLSTAIPTTTITTTPTTPCLHTAISGKACILPFTYKGVPYYCCLTEDEPDNRPWCPLDPVNFNVGQAGNYWDYCSKFRHSYKDLTPRINHVKTQNTCFLLSSWHERKPSRANKCPSPLPLPAPPMEKAPE